VETVKSGHNAERRENAALLFKHGKSAASGRHEKDGKTPGDLVPVKKNDRVWAFR